jgi:hypothetical protein
MRKGFPSGKPEYLDFNPEVERRLVYNRKLGEFAEPPKQFQHYIKMIPIPWLSEAFKLPFSAVRVGLACWFMDGCNRQNPFTLNRAVCRRFNISKWDKRRGLRRLEEAGLIQLQRRLGRLSLIGMVREQTPAIGALETK